MQTTRLHGLSQLVKEPTRVTEFTSTAIDLVFVNNIHRIVSHGVQDFGASDHSINFAVKKAGVCKALVEICDVRSFKHYNKEHFQRDIASIESAENPKDMWRSLNSVIGSNNQGGSPFQVNDRKRLVSEPKSVATKFNKFFAATGSKVAGRLCPVSKDAWKKYETVREANKQGDIESAWDLQWVEQKTVQRILHSLKVNKAAGLDKIPARLLKDAEVELAPSIT